MAGLTVSRASSRLSVLQDIAAFTPEAFRQFGRHVKDEWIVEALAAAKGHATLRRRKLPVERTLWLVIGMGLFRDRSIHEVAERLDLALPGTDGRDGIAPSAIPRARERLGAEAVERVFEVTAAHWLAATAEARPWRGLTLLGIDGSHVRIPDTPENEAAFGRPPSWRGRSGYPQVRLVGLFGLRSRVLGAMTVGAYRTGEQTLVEPLWAQVPDHSLTCLDRGFLSWWPLWRLATSGTERHWLVRAKANLAWRRVKALGRGDAVVEITVPPALHRQHPEMPETFRVRAVKRQVHGYRAYWVLTSALDPARYPATELAALYHERWEMELAYDEIKTHLLDREEALRSKSPEGIRQEIAGLGIAYNLVRLEMAAVAAQLGVPPARISFLHTLHAVQDFMAWAWVTSPGALPRRVESHDRKVRLYLLPERRTTRRYRRHVKIKMSNYPRNPGRPGAGLK